MQDTILAQGVELMIYGMGTVVVFLALLVLATTAMSALVARFFPEAQKPPAARPAPVAAQDDAEVVAAISAAIHRHRLRRRS